MVCEGTSLLTSEKPLSSLVLPLVVVVDSCSLDPHATRYTLCAFHCDSIQLTAASWLYAREEQRKTVTKLDLHSLPVWLKRRFPHVCPKAIKMLISLSIHTAWSQLHACLTWKTARFPTNRAPARLVCVSWTVSCWCWRELRSDTLEKILLWENTRERGWLGGGYDLQGESTMSRLCARFESVFMTSTPATHSCPLSHKPSTVERNQPQFWESGPRTATQGELRVDKTLPGFGSGHAKKQYHSKRVDEMTPQV